MSERNIAFIKHYFENVIEYDVALEDEILSVNTFFSYISSTFLNGFINYVEIKKAYLLDRYNKWEEEFDEPYPINLLVNDKWVKKYCNTKQEIFDNITKKDVVFHTKIYDLRDDVFILAKPKNTKSGNDIYLMFYYDLDSSDCMIGRFKSSDSIEVMQNKIDEQLNKWQNFYKEGKAKEIPLHFFRGWISG